MDGLIPGQAIAKGWTLLDVLRHRAAGEPDRDAVLFLSYPGDAAPAEERLTYGALAQRSGAVAAALQRHCRKGDRALILCPPGLDYITAFYGCVMAGVVAVPAYPPRNARHMGRLTVMLEDAGATAILTTAALSERLPAWAGADGSLPWRLATDAVDLERAGDWRDPGVGQDDLVFLQYTSGTTGTPKGVMVTHAQLLANVEKLAVTVGLDRQSIAALWLPPFHDMGLVAGLVLPICVGYLIILMSPAAFLQRPNRWLEALTTYRAAFTTAPNFAYRLCVEKARAEDIARLDLAPLRQAVNGAEVVRRETLQAFAATFGPAGFSPRAFTPAYGMAETVLMATAVRSAEVPSVLALSSADLVAGRVVVRARLDIREPAPATDGITTVVSCGPVIPGHDLRIVDPATAQERPAGEVGEIWLSGASTAAGYWQKPQATQETFRARLAGTPAAAFLRTGDLGAIVDGELYVLGRIKEMVIIRGNNHYASDLEATASAGHAALGADRTIAFAVDESDEEQLILAHELSRPAMRHLDASALLQAIRTAVISGHEIDPAAIVLVRPGTLPRTTSGKLQRGTARGMYLADTLSVVAAWHRQAPRAGDGDGAEDVGGWLARWREAARPQRERMLREQLAERIRDALGLASAPGAATDFAELGIDSLLAVELSTRLNGALRLDPPLPATVLYDLPNLAALASLVAPRLNMGGASRAGSAGSSRTPEPGADSIAVTGGEAGRIARQQKLAVPAWPDNVPAALDRLYGGRAAQDDWLPAAELFSRFRREDGAGLQCELEEHFRRAPEFAYFDLYRDAYLARRERLAFDPSAQVGAAVLALEGALAQASVAQRCGALVAALVAVRDQATGGVKGGGPDPDATHLRHLSEALTMIRRIGIQRDSLIPARHASRHVVAFHAGTIFEIEIGGLSAGEIAGVVFRVVAELLSAPRGDGPQNTIPGLTEADKPDAVRLRAACQTHAGAAQTIGAIEGALCVLVVDPESGTDPAALQRLTLFGRGADRWYGQFHLVVYRSPFLGFVTDHATLDGLSGERLATEITRRAQVWAAGRPGGTGARDAGVAALPLPPAPIRDALAAVIAKSRRDAAALDIAHRAVQSVPRVCLAMLANLYPIAVARAGLSALGAEADIYTSVALSRFIGGRITGVRARPQATSHLLGSWPSIGEQPEPGLVMAAMTEWRLLHQEAAGGTALYTHLALLSQVSRSTGRGRWFFDHPRIQELLDWPPLVSSGILPTNATMRGCFPAPLGGIGITGTVARRPNQETAQIELVAMSDTGLAASVVEGLRSALTSLIGATGGRSYRRGDSATGDWRTGGS